MGLRTRLNILLVLVAGLGAALFALATTPFLESLARDEVVQKSRVMMESATGARTYTSREVAPLIGDMNATFHPQAVSAYAAVKMFGMLHDTFPDYAYREVALNPTNLDDRPSDWEADIVQYFRTNPKASEVITQRASFRGPILSLSRPIRVDQRCLACHDTPAAAPAPMVAHYGADHGFGWKLNEIIGAQVVSVPMSVAFDQASRIRWVFLGLFLGVFALLGIVLNIAFGAMVIGPVMKLARTAEDVSMGKADVPEYTRKGKDQIATLAASFSRMRRSLEHAMRLLSERR